MKPWLLWILGLSLLALLTSYAIAEARAQQRIRQCKANAHALQFALGRYDSDFHPANWPAFFWTTEDFSAVIREGYLDPIPLNPYSGEPVRQLHPGEPNAPGDFRYLTCRQFIRMKSGELRSESSQYILVVYLSSDLIQVPQSKLLGFRLGKEPFLELGSPNEVMIRRSQNDVTNPNEALASSRMETWDQALTRQGY